MSGLYSKASAISRIVFSVIAVLFLVLPAINILIKVVIGLLAVFTYVLHFIALKKKGLWDLISWLWSAFCLPLFSAQIVAVGYIGRFVSTETVAVWGLPMSLSLLLPFTWSLMKYLRIVFAEMYQVP